MAIIVTHEATPEFAKHKQVYDEASHTTET